MKKYIVVSIIILSLISVLLYHDQVNKPDHDIANNIQNGDFDINLSTFDYNENIELLEENSSLYSNNSDLPFYIELKSIKYLSPITSESGDPRLIYKIRVASKNDNASLSYLFTYKKEFVDKFMLSGTYILTPERVLNEDEGMSFTIDEIVVKYDSLNIEQQKEYISFIKSPLLIIEYNQRQYSLELNYSGLVEGIEN